MTFLQVLCGVNHSVPVLFFARYCVIRKSWWMRPTERSCTARGAGSRLELVPCTASLGTDGSFAPKHLKTKHGLRCMMSFYQVTDSAKSHGNDTCCETDSELMAKRGGCCYLPNEHSPDYFSIWLKYISTFFSLICKGYANVIKGSQNNIFIIQLTYTYLTSPVYPI